VHYSTSTVTAKGSLVIWAQKSAQFYAYICSAYVYSFSNLCLSACCLQQFALKACISEKVERIILHIFVTWERVLGFYNSTCFYVHLGKDENYFRILLKGEFVYWLKTDCFCTNTGKGKYSWISLLQIKAHSTRFVVENSTYFQWHIQLCDINKALSIIITIVDNIHRLVCHLKHSFSEIGFCLRLSLWETTSNYLA
jgi:hypothetical protein